MAKAEASVEELVGMIERGERHGTTHDQLAVQHSQKAQSATIDRLEN